MILTIIREGSILLMWFFIKLGTGLLIAILSIFLFVIYMKEEKGKRKIEQLISACVLPLLFFIYPLLPTDNPLVVVDSHSNEPESGEARQDVINRVLSSFSHAETIEADDLAITFGVTDDDFISDYTNTDGSVNLDKWGDYFNEYSDYESQNKGLLYHLNEIFSGKTILVRGVVGKRDDECLELHGVGAVFCFNIDESSLSKIKVNDEVIISGTFIKGQFSMISLENCVAVDDI